VLHKSLMSALVFTMTVAFAGGVLAEPTTTPPAPSTPTSSETMTTGEKDAVKPAMVKPHKNTTKMKKSTKEKKAKAQKPAVE
jgi:hypothetical protein